MPTPRKKAAAKKEATTDSTESEDNVDPRSESRARYSQQREALRARDRNQVAEHNRKQAELDAERQVHNERTAGTYKP